MFLISGEFIQFISFIHEEIYFKRISLKIPVNFSFLMSPSFKFILVCNFTKKASGSLKSPSSILSPFSKLNIMFIFDLSYFLPLNIIKKSLDILIFLFPKSLQKSKREIVLGDSIR